MTATTTNSIAINLQEFILWNKSLVGTVLRVVQRRGWTSRGSPGSTRPACCSSTR